MSTKKFIRFIFPLVLFVGMACVSFSGPLIMNKPSATSTPDEDATVAAVITDINAPPSLVAWIATVNKMGTQAEQQPPTKSLKLDGNWDGKGSTSNITGIHIAMVITNNEIVDITIDYEGTEGASCQLRASATEADFKADFLPAKIDSYGNMQLGKWGLIASFYKDNKVNGNMKIHINEQSKLECNTDFRATWSATKQ